MTGDVKAVAAALILARKEELARTTTDMLYAAEPSLLTRFGEAGRAKCLQDSHYCLEHLASAVALGDPRLFARYVRWLASLLVARGIGTGDVRHSLDATRAALVHSLSAQQMESVDPSIAAGLAALSDSIDSP